MVESSRPSFFVIEVARRLQRSGGRRPERSCSRLAVSSARLGGAGRGTPTDLCGRTIIQTGMPRFVGIEIEINAQTVPFREGMVIILREELLVLHSTRKALDLLSKARPLPSMLIRAAGVVQLTGERLGGVPASFGHVEYLKTRSPRSRTVRQKALPSDMDPQESS